MAVGEYVSVSSQSDVTKADLNMEARALRDQPRAELAELTEIWSSRGLRPELAREVAVQLTEADALAAHARDELGRSEEHTSELQSLMRISYAVFCLKKKKNTEHNKTQ